MKSIKPLELTGAETAVELVCLLVRLRICARAIVRSAERWRRLADGGDASLSLYAKERLLDIRFGEIEIGQFLMPLCDALDAKVDRARIFDALNVNAADRDSENVRRYGSKAQHLICVLDLENSATPSDDIVLKPLKWCWTQYFMHSLRTNEKLDRKVHEGANEFFNGIFGEYRERPLTDRLIGGKA